MKNNDLFQISVLLVLLLLVTGLNFFYMSSKDNKSFVKTSYQNLPSTELSVKINPEVMREMNKSNGTMNVLVEINSSNENLQDYGKVIRKTNKYYEIQIPISSVNKISKEVSVKKIYPDYVYKTMLDKSVPQIKAEIFWNSGYTGSGIKIAVLDTGVNKNHPMLRDKVILERDFTTDNNPSDLNGHGTHVSSIAAGANYNGLSGVAPDAKIINAKVLNYAGVGSDGNIIAAIEWAVDPDGNPATDDGADIITMSLGSETNTPNPALIDAINYAISKGIIVIAASGNCGECSYQKCSNSFFGVTSPGSIKDIISVGSVNDYDEHSCFSGGKFINGTGIKPDVVAPGEFIRAASFSGGLVEMSGTSMATPHVAGSVALLLQKDPGLNQYQVKRYLERSSKDLGQMGTDVYYGSGRIDLQRLMDYDPLYELAFNISFKKVLNKSDVNPIKISISPGNLVTNVLLKTKNPQGNESLYQISGDRRDYWFNFSNTGLEGAYLADLTIQYNYSHKVYYYITFNVVSPDNNVSINLAANTNSTISTKDPLPIRVNLTNPNYIKQDVKLSLLLKKENSIIYSYQWDTVTVEGYKSLQKEMLWKNNWSSGDYVLEISADYFNKRAVKDLPLRITEKNKPRILQSNATSQKFLGGLFKANILVFDESKTYGFLEITRPDSINEIIDMRQQYSFVNQTLEGAYVSGMTGTYVYKYTICDEFDNCIVSNTSSFTISNCNAKNTLLFIKGTDHDVSDYYSDANSCITRISGKWNNKISYDKIRLYDAVFIMNGNSLSSFESGFVNALYRYSSAGGSIMLEGSDIYTNINNQSVYSRVTHTDYAANKNSDIFGNDYLRNKTIYRTRSHPIFNGIPESIFFDASKSPLYDSIIVGKDAYGIASWNDSTSAMMIYNGIAGSGKILYIPFSLNAISDGISLRLMNNSVNWLLDKPSHDFSIKSLTFEYKNEYYLVAEIDNSGTNSVSSYASYIDNYMHSSGNMILNSGSNIIKIPLAENMIGQKHDFKFVINNDFIVSEQDYLNDELSIRNLTIPEKLPDLKMENVSYRYGEKGIFTLDFDIINSGAGWASEFNLEVYQNGSKIFKESTGIKNFDKKNYNIEVEALPGRYDVEILVNNNMKLEESDYTNNRNSLSVRFCEKEKILVIDNNDADEILNYDGHSASIFLNALKDADYCVDFFNESKSGLPDKDMLSGYDIIVVSSGRYWNGLFNASELQLLKGYSGNLLFEGSDIIFDSQSDDVAESIFKSKLYSDYVLNSTVDLDYSENAITKGISKISINATIDKYPDGMISFSGNSIASWFNESSAIFTLSENGKKIEVIGFSIDAITDIESRNKLIRNSVEWLLTRENIITKEYANLSFVDTTDGVDITLNLSDKNNSYPIKIYLSDFNGDIIDLLNNDDAELYDEGRYFSGDTLRLSFKSDEKVQYLYVEIDGNVYSIVHRFMTKGTPKLGYIADYKIINKRVQDGTRAYFRDKYGTILYESKVYGNHVYGVLDGLPEELDISTYVEGYGKVTERKYESSGYDEIEVSVN